MLLDQALLLSFLDLILIILFLYLHPSVLPFQHRHLVLVMFNVRFTLMLILDPIDQQHHRHYLIHGRLPSRLAPQCNPFTDQSFLEVVSLLIVVAVFPCTAPLKVYEVYE